MYKTSISNYNKNLVHLPYDIIGTSLYTWKRLEDGSMWLLHLFDIRTEKDIKSAMYYIKKYNEPVLFFEYFRYDMKLKYSYTLDGGLKHE